MTSVNRYSGRCACCGKTVAAGAGIYAWGAVLCSIVEDAAPDDFFSSPRSERARDFLGKILSH